MFLLTLLFYALLLFGVLMGILWGWALYHASTTPHTPVSRRGLWIFALIINPLASMWYWYIWKRWAFWSLFAPVILFTTFLPQTLEGVLRTLEFRSMADRFVEVMTTILEEVIDVIPLPILIPLLVFPFILRLAALTHLGGNTDLKAADRNDHAVTFALPLFGYGAAMVYCMKWRRVWATLGLAWFLLATGVLWSFVRYL
ncbi:hypothetical protein GF380_01790 [Candidatus Uhrbacteria bacterium]|nr:hypothetical protein [Candidatus Uhrbacteria bacterium]